MPPDASPSGPSLDAASPARAGRIAAFSVLLTLLLIPGSFVGCSQFMRSRPVYQRALELARQDSLVQARLGRPITDSFWVNGSIEQSGSSGWADFTGRLKGPSRSARFSVQGTLRPDLGWVVRSVTVHAEGGPLRYEFGWDGFRAASGSPCANLPPDTPQATRTAMGC